MAKIDTPRLSYQSLVILRTFLDRPMTELCGAELLRLTNLSSGTLYPVLVRFEKCGLLESDWEHHAPEASRRRRRYRITPHGGQIARQVLTKVGG